MSDKTAAGAVASVTVITGRRDQDEGKKDTALFIAYAVFSFFFAVYSFFLF